MPTIHYAPAFSSRRLAAWTTAIALVLGAALPSTAVADYAGAPPSAAAMGVDVLLIRPVSLVATVLGTGLFVVSLPFSLLGGNVDAAASQLVAAPASYTFLRPLGDFEDGPGFGY